MSLEKSRSPRAASSASAGRVDDDNDDGSGTVPLANSHFGDSRVSITKFKRCRLTRHRDERNKIKANARIAHDLHVERHVSGSRICISRFGARSPSYGETVKRSRKKNLNSRKRVNPRRSLSRKKIVTSAIHFALCSLRSTITTMFLVCSSSLGVSVHD